MGTNTFDTIIVGGGTAGCVLAARLTEDPSHEVLLIESGPENAYTELHHPSSLSSLFRTGYDWDFTTTPQVHAADRSFRWPRGKVLGGCSSINSMIYSRGHQDDYVSWSAGGVSWDYETLLPYFRRSEDNSRGTSTFHGSGGPMKVSDLPSYQPSSMRFVEMAMDAGHPFNPDFCGAVQSGVGYYQFTRRDGARESTATAYLDPVRHRRNLQLLTDSTVQTIRVDKGKPTGVVVKTATDNITTVTGARIILSAGTIGTPTILLRSGIGPPDALRAAGIDVAIDSPAVGKNLADHVAVTVTSAPSSLTGPLDSGPLTTGLAESGGFFSTQGMSTPNAQWLAVPRPDHTLPDVIVSLVDVRSRGEIRIARRSTGTHTSINPCYFADDADYAAMVQAIRHTRAVLELPQLSDTDSWVRQNAVSLYHPVGTCRFGAEPGTSVCDPTLRLWGSDNLSIVDASVMPTLPRGNTNAPVAAIAERAAELLAR